VQFRCNVLLQCSAAQFGCSVPVGPQRRTTEPDRLCRSLAAIQFCRAVPLSRSAVLFRCGLPVRRSNELLRKAVLQANLMLLRSAAPYLFVVPLRLCSVLFYYAVAQFHCSDPCVCACVSVCCAIPLQRSVAPFRCAAPLCCTVVPYRCAVPLRRSGVILLRRSAGPFCCAVPLRLCVAPFRCGVPVRRSTSLFH